MWKWWTFHKTLKATSSLEKLSFELKIDICAHFGKIFQSRYGPGEWWGLVPTHCPKMIPISTFMKELLANFSRLKTSWMSTCPRVKVPDCAKSFLKNCRTMGRVLRHLVWEWKDNWWVQKFASWHYIFS